MTEVLKINIGEIRAYDYLTRNGWIIDDLTKCPQYFDKDIDFLAHSDSEAHTIEVKWDSRIADTGNMFIETITDLDKSMAGWFEFCQAEYIFYGDSQNELFYVFKTDDLRDFVSHNTMEERKAADYSFLGKIKKVSQGMIVPIEPFSTKYNVQVIRLGQESQSNDAKRGQKIFE